jgi:Flp pilus assembly protein TadG
MKIKALSKLKKEASGQSLVELAISLIIIVMLLLGAVETSLALFQYVTIRDAAQEGALFASIHPAVADEDGVKYHAVAAASDVVQLPMENITVSRNNAKECEGSTSGTPNTITVTIVFDHKITFPLVKPMIGTDNVRLTASVTNTILRPSCEAPTP